MSTQEEIASHLDLSARQVRNLLTSGDLPSHKGRAGYSLDACRVAYIQYLRGLGKRPESTIMKTEDDDVFDVDIERARNLRVDTELKERKRDSIDRTVAPIHLLEWILSNLGTKISAILGTIPQKVKRRVPRLSSNEIHLIEKEVVKCQNIASDMKVDLESYDSTVGNSRGD